MREGKGNREGAKLLTADCGEHDELLTESPHLLYSPNIGNSPGLYKENLNFLSIQPNDLPDRKTTNPQPVEPQRIRAEPGGKPAK